ncbi:MAG: FG-GAP repeat domain-containing protein [Phycisphaerales bacterium]
MTTQNTRPTTLSLTALALLAFAGVAHAATPAPASLARFFGFDEPRTIVIDDNCGPALAADMDGDGKLDLVVVNNAKSRIEIHRQRDASRTDEQMERELKVNELPPSRWYDKTEVSVAHRVTGFRVFDIDNDRRQDIVYAGIPGELVVLKQKTQALNFEVLNKRRVAELGAGQDGFDIVDVQGDPRPELLAIANGKVNVFTLGPSGPVGEPTLLGSGGKMVAFLNEDYNGDGSIDVLGVIPDDPAPLRLFLASSASAEKQLGPETRFEMPGLVEAEPLRFTGRKGASIAVIERASKRKVMYDLTTESVATGAEGVERDAAADVYAFRGGANKARSTVVADINADGKPDLLTTDQSANSVVLYLQTTSGLDEGKPFSAFKDPKTVALGQWNDTPALEAFILSEEEKAVGVATYDTATNRLSFPAPITIKTPGAAPVAMNHLTVAGKPALAVVVKDKRDHALELHRPPSSDGTATEPTIVKLDGVSRPPQSMMGGDFDHDGKTDVLLFTPGEPMVMVKNVAGEGEGTDGKPAAAEVLTDKKMPNFGLVQAAGPDNTALLDVDNDNFPELLIADKNFVRFCALDTTKGWKVIDQVTMPEASSQLSGLSVLTSPNTPPTIVAADKAGKRIILMAKGKDGAWTVTDKLRLTGFDVGAVNAGTFTGDKQPGVMVLADDAFAIVRLAGEKQSLTQFAAHRTDRDERQEHEIEAADLNSDGFLDMVVLDAGEQMCELFTFSTARKLLPATEWEVFESRLFSRGDSREFEPSAAITADLTGDGLPDLTLAVHNRYMIYPQMKK